MPRIDQTFPSTLRVARITEHTRVLGPGLRAAIWVQGCPLRCAGCLAPEALSFDGGTEVEISDLAERLLDASPAIDGVTYSGGEPFAQAAGLATLADLMRRRRPTLSIMSYSGFTKERLLARGTAEQVALLERLDLLVDGPYVASRHASLRWRGSANQRIHLLSPRHRAAELLPDESAGVELEVTDEPAFAFAGVPPTPGFRQAVADALTTAGLALEGSVR